MSGARRPASLARGLLLLVAAGVVWGTIGTAVRVAHERSGMAALTISAYRAIAAVVVLVAVVLALRRLDACRRVARAHGRRVVVVGAMTAGFQGLFAVAVVMTGVGVATVVCLGFAPVLLLVVASARRRAAPRVASVLTVAAALAGLVLVSAGGGGSDAPHPAVGVVLALASGGFYALSADAGAGLSHEDTLAVTTLTMGVATAVMVPVGLVSGVVGGGPLGTTDPVAWLLVAYLGVFTMAIAYALLFAGLRSTPSDAAVVATLVEPVTAVALAAAVLGESLTPGGVVGSLLILLAIASLAKVGDAAPEPEAEPPH